MLSMSAAVQRVSSAKDRIGTVLLPRQMSRIAGHTLWKPSYDVLKLFLSVRLVLQGCWSVL